MVSGVTLSTAVDTDKPELLVYQQNLDVASLRLAKLDFVKMQASQFNMIGTNPQFFRNIYGVDYNQAVSVNLWRAQEQEVPLRTEPVAGGRLSGLRGEHSRLVICLLRRRDP